METHLPQINKDVEVDAEVGAGEAGVKIAAQVTPEGGKGTIDVDPQKSPGSISIKG
jgi:hypothetical protein